MKKNLLKCLATLLCLCMFAGCSFPGTNTQSPFDNQGDVDPVKPQNGDDDNSNPGDVQIDVSIYPSKIEVESKIVEDLAAADISVIATDEDGKTLWTKDFGRVMVGQYDSYTAIGIRDNKYYIAVDCVLYCLDVFTGEQKWYEEGVGSSCSWDFDDKDTIYIAGYEGPALVVIDKNGITLSRFGELMNAKEFEDFYWTSGLYYEDGKVRKTFFNNPYCLIIDPETGMAEKEKFGEINTSQISRKWALVNYSTDKDSETHYAKELNGGCTISITDDFGLSFNYENGDDKYETYYVPCVLRPRNLYDGIREDFYGVWSAEGDADKNNSFAFQMSEPDTLVLLWFKKDDAGNVTSYMRFEFMDAEVLQYHQDKLNMNK